MARPIKETPFLYGDEALQFEMLRVRLATSYVLENSGNGAVMGYFSLAHDRISLTGFPSNAAYNRFRKRFFAQGKMFKSYPALKICCLATDKSCFISPWKPLNLESLNLEINHQTINKLKPQTS